MDETIYDIAIIGSGGAGQMAILRAVLNHLNTVAFLGDADTIKRSRSTWVTEVDNIPGMFGKKRPISASTKDVLNFVDANGGLKKFLSPLKKAAKKIRKKDNLFYISSDNMQDIIARYIVLCTGTMDIQPMINGSIEPIFPFANNNDVFYCIRCDGHKTVGHHCAVIGYDEGAAWVAIMLKERYHLPGISVLTNGDLLEVSKKTRDIIERYKIKIYEAPIEAVLGEVKTGLEGFLVGDKTVSATKGFIALGSIVYNNLAKGLGVKVNEREHVITNDKGETSIEGFYAAGDLVAGKKKQVYTAWDMAVDAVDDIDKNLRRAKREEVL